MHLYMLRDCLYTSFTLCVFAVDSFLVLDFLLASGLSILLGGKVTEQYFQLVLFVVLCRVVLTFETG